MRMYEIVLKLKELKDQRDKLMTRLEKDPRNTELGEEIVSLIDKIRVLESDRISLEQQLQEGWPADQE